MNASPLRKAARISATKSSKSAVARSAPRLKILSPSFSLTPQPSRWYIKLPNVISLLPEARELYVYWDCLSKSMEKKWANYFSFSKCSLI